MSTPQQPGGGHESYAQPQDPWAGQFEPGLASVPTDPIPQQPGPYASPQPADVWSQPTMPQGAPPQYAYVPQQPPRRGNAGVIVLVSILVLVLGGGGGYAAYRVLTSTTGNGHPNASGPSALASTTASTATSAPAVFPYTVKVGDCVFNAGTPEDPQLEQSDCARAGSYKVVKIASGPGIPRAANGKFDRDTTANAVCAGVTYQTWFGYQTGKPALDLFFCMTNNPS
jgi:hypothetical protein